MDVKNYLGADYFSNKVRYARRITEDCYVVDQSYQTRNGIVLHFRQVEALHWLLKHACDYG